MSVLQILEGESDERKGMINSFPVQNRKAGFCTNRLNSRMPIFIWQWYILDDLNSVMAKYIVGGSVNTVLFWLYSKLIPQFICRGMGGTWFLIL